MSVPAQDMGRDSFFVSLMQMLTTQHGLAYGAGTINFRT